jgi:hypothetical protein
MQANFRSSGSTSQSFVHQESSVSDLVLSLIEEYRPVCKARGIRLELDVQPLEATVEVELIRTALRGLLGNAVDTTPDGGEIFVTSIDGIHQWEIEVADSSRYRHRNPDPLNEFNELNVSEQLPVILPFPATDKLRNAYRAAFEHDGQIENWRCPQGGLAYALVIPRRRNNRLS